MKSIYIKLSVIGLSIFLGIGTIIVVAQKSEKQTKLIVESSKNVIGESVNSKGLFSKMSSTEEASNDGFEIISVKRVFLYINNSDDDVKKRRDLVEIELRAQVISIGSSLMDIVQIGDKTFFPDILPRKDSGYCVKIFMSPKEFDELKDNSLINLYNGLPPNPEKLKEMYKNGEPEQIKGAKFGRLDKKKINDYPPSEKVSN